MYVTSLCVSHCQCCCHLRPLTFNIHSISHNWLAQLQPNLVGMLFGSSSTFCVLIVSFREFSMDARTNYSLWLPEISKIFLCWDDIWQECWKIFMHFNFLKPLNHLNANLSGKYLLWSFPNECFCVNLKSIISTMAGHTFNIGLYGKMKKVNGLLVQSGPKFEAA